VEVREQRQGIILLWHSQLYTPLLNEKTTVLRLMSSGERIWEGEYVNKPAFAMDLGEPVLALNLGG
jgi:hypothetical protein